MRGKRKVWTQKELNRLQRILDENIATSSKQHILRATGLTEGQLKYAKRLLKLHSAPSKTYEVCPACGRQCSRFDTSGFCVPCELAREADALRKTVENYQVALGIEPEEAQARAPMKKPLKLSSGASVEEQEQELIKYRKRQVATLKRQVNRLRERMEKKDVRTDGRS